MGYGIYRDLLPLGFHRFQCRRKESTMKDARLFYDE